MSNPRLPLDRGWWPTSTPTFATVTLDIHPTYAANGDVHRDRGQRPRVYELLHSPTANTEQTRRLSLGDHIIGHASSVPAMS